ncbi:MAG: YbjN domain-containing protein [Pseudomonadota bacterium]|nr:YbjN domain-containing protein [Pseudomonadota bacterium]
MKLKLLACFFALLIAPVLAPATAGAQEIVARDPLTVVNAMQNLGYRAELSTDSQGDPLITSAASGYRFVVFFYGCTDGAECQNLQFNASFDMEGQVDLKLINEWNAKFRFTKAFADDEGDPIIVMDLILGREGAVHDHFKTILQEWETHVADYTEHVGFD